MKEGNWKEIFKTGKEQHVCVCTLCSDKKLCSKLWQTLSDEKSSRKRQTRDLKLTCSGYNSPVTRFVIQKDQQKQFRQAEVAELKRKLLKQGANGEVMYSL